jgi:hypothetical protein
MSLKEIKERHEHLINNQLDKVLKDKNYADKESLAYAFEQAHQDRGELLKLVEESLKHIDNLIGVIDKYDSECPCGEVYDAAYFAAKLEGRAV